MNPERWLRIDELFSAALERPDAERGAFLAVGCGGDEALRVEVERLLSAYQAASGFLETPPAGAVPPFPAGTWTDANLPTRDAGSASTAGANLPSLSLSSSAPPGTVLGRYIILNRLGRGGMGVVYVAYDPELDRKVALKLLRAEGAGAGRDGRARLLREAQAMARLSHPNVIAVHDVGTFGEQVFIAMEFIDGHTLKRWLKEKQRSVREIVDALVQAGRGLAAAHAAGLVHRDFKPDNVLVAKDGRVKVLDFGLARPVEDLLGSAPTVPPAFGTGSGKPVLSDPLTRTGALFGTPGYMAPEQFLGKPTDARTDQFSFCITLHEALYGERPFGGDSLEALKEQLAAGKVREPERPVRVPAVVRQVLRRGLRADPSERYPSMDAVLQDLGKDPRAKRRRAFTVGALALGLAAITVGYRQQWRRQLQICKGAGQKLAGVWDEERRGVLAAAFTASGKPYAADALRAVQQALDGYARGWVDMHTEACEATRLRGEQSEELLDLRMMRAGLFQGLGTLVIKEGKHADALEYSRRAQEIWERIFGPEHPNVADTLSNAAIALRQLGRYQEAVDNYRRTAAIKEKVYGTNHPWVVASDSNLGIVYRSQGRYELAVEHHRRALELSEKLLGPQHPWVSRTLSNFGASLTGLGRYDEALTYLQRGLQLGEKTYGPKHLEVGRILGNIGRALLGEEQYQPALEHLQRSLGIVEKVSGPDHPELVLLLVDLALGRFERHKPGDSDAAEEYLRRALAIREKASGPESPEIADVLSAMAQILREKDPRKALEHLERARQIREKSLPADSLLIPATLADIADVHLRLRQPLEAKRVLERALLLQSNGNPPTNVARTKFLMARALWDANSDKERAVTLSEAARAELLEAGRRKTRIYRQLEAWLASRTAAGRNM